MNYRQNERTNQITQETLIIGVDIAKFYHVARALDDRGIDLSKKITFRNSLEGFLKFEQWITENQAKNKKSKADLREAMNVRNVTLQSLQQVKNKLHRWYDRFFPEYKQVYKSCYSKGLIHILSFYGLPHEIAERDPIKLFESLDPAYRQIIGKKRILSLHEACKKASDIKNQTLQKKNFKFF